MNIKTFLKRILLMVVLFVAAESVHAQDLLKGKDLTQVKVDQMSDDEVLKFKTQLLKAKVTLDQAEQIALSKGMPQAEFTKLRKRVTMIPEDAGLGKLNKAPETNPRTNTNIPLDSAVYNKTEKSKPLIDPLIFGSELYTASAPSFEPPSNLATPMNYILGPDDQITILVYGVQEYSGDHTVSPEGNVSIPNVGQVKVAGLTIEAATQKLKTVMGNGAYSYLRSGGAKLSVTVSKIRSIKVTIIGSYQPGNYTLSSLSTVFNALYVAGGPSAFGSFREIELLRNNRVERKIDLYRLMLHGDQSDNIALRDNDVIRIPPYKTRVELQGQVKRPGIFEVLAGETFRDVVDFASGFTDTAYRASVKIFQRNERERTIQDLSQNLFDQYKPQSGDLFIISKLLNRFQNRVFITGAVFRPDVYELTPGMRISDLIRKADGLKEDAFIARAQIIRLQEDLTRSIVSLDLRKVFNGDTASNPRLQREDEVLISSVDDLRDSLKVTIQGEVRKPGEYNYVSNLTLKDLIIQADGFTDAAYNNVEIARLIRRDTLLPGDLRSSNIIRSSMEVDMGSGSSNIRLEPFDLITIRRKAGYNMPESVIIVGQVQYPGPYAISSRNERISDLLKRAGGYTPDAFPEGAYLRRYKSDEEKRKSGDVVKKIQENVKDSTNKVVQEILRDYDQIPIDMNQIAKKPGSIEDLVLKSRDEIYIPKFDAQVKVSGAVLLVTQVPYQQGNNLKDYVNEAGGYSADAWRRKAYVVYANGKAATTKHFFFVKFYPKILPGSELVVPKKQEKKGASTAEVIGIASALASLAGVVIALLRL